MAEEEGTENTRQLERPRVYSLSMQCHFTAMLEHAMSMNAV